MLKTLFRHIPYLESLAFAGCKGEKVGPYISKDTYVGYTPDCSATSIATS